MRRGQVACAPHLERTHASKMYKVDRDTIGIGFLFVVDKLHAHLSWKGLMLVRCIELAVIQLGSDFFASCRVILYMVSTCRSVCRQRMLQNLV